MKVFWKQFFSISVLVAVSLVLLGNVILQVTFVMSLTHERERDELDLWLFRYSMEASFDALPDKYPIGESTAVDIIKNIYENVDGGQDYIRIWRGDGFLLYENRSLPEEKWDTKINAKEGAARIRNVGAKHFIESLIVLEIDSGTIWVEKFRDIEYVYEIQQKILQIYIIVLGVMLLLSFPAAALISGSITKPVRNLNTVTNRFSKGDYESRARVRGSDEFTELAVHFNNMADNLQDNIIKLENFTGAFAHEMRTPLTSIIGYSEMLLTMELAESDRITCAGYINSQGKRLEKLSNKMLELSGIAHDEIRFEEIGIKDLFDAVDGMVSFSLTKKSVTLKLSAEADTIYGDRELVITLLTNLIDNARKAVGQGGVIGLSAEKRTYEECGQTGVGFDNNCPGDGDTNRHGTGQCTVITVRDDGIGIDGDQIKRITEAFYMVDKSRTRKEGGAGLGLALCEEIIKLHSWQWNIRSTKGVGTQIEIMIPEVRDEV
ncbi:MAG: HAMP domain-containing histidine kinase [Lachnospiraceae bacterium]|nr:HAMP domain-containing histidine kinase [Lachnospiraceae bacterium]